LQWRPTWNGPRTCMAWARCLPAPNATALVAWLACGLTPMQHTWLQLANRASATTCRHHRAPATCPRSPKDSVPWQPKPLSTGKSCSSPAGSQFRAAAVRQNVTSGPRFRAGSRFRAVAVRQDAHRMCMLQRQTFSTHRKTVAGIRTSEVHAHSASRGKYMALNGHRSVSLYR